MDVEREQYLSEVGPRESEVRALDTLIRASAPALEPVLTTTKTGVILGYGPIPYRTKSMKEPIAWPIVALAARKNYVSLYISAVQDGRYVAEANAARLGKVDVGKSCIRLEKFADLDTDALREILADLDRRYRAGEKLYG